MGSAWPRAAGWDGGVGKAEGSPGFLIIQWRLLQGNRVVGCWIPGLCAGNGLGDRGQTCTESWSWCHPLFILSQLNFPVPGAGAILFLFYPNSVFLSLELVPSYSFLYPNSIFLSLELVPSSFSFIPTQLSLSWSWLLPAQGLEQ